MCPYPCASTLAQHAMRPAGGRYEGALSGAAAVPRVSPRGQHSRGDGVVFTANVVPMGKVQRPLSEEEVRWAFEGVSDLHYFGDAKFKRFVSSLP